jgi:hypothetical protein
MEDAGDRTWSCWIQALSLHEDLLRAADLVGRLRSRLPESSSLEAAEATVIVEFDDFEGVVVVGRTIGPDALRAMSEVGLDLGISVENPSI